MRLKTSTQLKADREIDRLVKAIRDVDRKLRLPKSDKDALLDQRLELSAALAELHA